jgi:diguanylate cyclase (GGDEF)-like protein
LKLADWTSQVHPDDAPTRLAAHRAHLDGATPAYANEYRVMHTNGHWVWIESRGKVVRRDPEGTPLRIVGTMMDISTRKQTEFAIRRLVCIDFLTGAATRREFFDVAEREFARAARYELPLSLLALDLDHFKGINDRFGHAVGDIVLKSFVETAKTYLREFDTFGRTGGEEFCILLPQTHLAGARALARRILKGVHATSAPTPDQPVKFTVSIGVAELTPQTPSLAALMHAADRALYRAKAEGRARVAVSA